MPRTDDERLLTGEVRRALARLAEIREVVEELLDEGDITVEVRNRLRALTREEQG